MRGLKLFGLGAALVLLALAAGNTGVGNPGDDNTTINILVLVRDSAGKGVPNVTVVINSVKRLDLDEPDEIPLISEKIITNTGSNTNSVKTGEDGIAWFSITLKEDFDPVPVFDKWSGTVEIRCQRETDGLIFPQQLAIVSNNNNLLLAKPSPEGLFGAMGVPLDLQQLLRSVIQAILQAILQVPELPPLSPSLIDWWGGAITPPPSGCPEGSRLVSRTAPKITDVQFALGPVTDGVTTAKFEISFTDPDGDLVTLIDQCEALTPEKVTCGKDQANATFEVPVGSEAKGVTIGKVVVVGFCKHNPGVKWRDTFTLVDQEGFRSNSWLIESADFGGECKWETEVKPLVEGAE